MDPKHCPRGGLSPAVLESCYIYYTVLSITIKYSTIKLFRGVIVCLFDLLDLKKMNSFYNQKKICLSLVYLLRFTGTVERTPTSVYTMYRNCSRPTSVQMYRNCSRPASVQMYRNWMNSLGVRPRVNYLYSDLYDGNIIFQVGFQN